MAFRDYVYEGDSGVSFQIRLDSDQATVAGGVVGASDIPAHVRVSSTRREFGVQPRHVIAKRLTGTAPDQKVRTTKLPICTPAAYAALNVGAAITINGTAYTIGSKVPEINR